MTKQHYSTYMLASALLLLMATNAIQVQAAPRASSSNVPRLIVGISVDQLRTDYLEALENKLSEDGFKRMLNQGLVYEQVTFDIDNPDATAALAILATGAYPFSNGVPSQEIFDVSKLRRQSVFYDKDCLGNFTAEHLSPKAIISSTLADELKTASAGASRIYCVAPEPEAAIISAGHTSDCALWLDDKTGQWASSAYYGDIPHYVVRKNKLQPLSVNLSAVNWEPMLSYRSGHTDILPYQKVSGSFNHSFYQFGQPAYSWIKTSPIINDAIVELAQLMLKEGKLGRNQSCTDMLQLTFYAGTYQHEKAEMYAEELQDIYMRLDQSLSTLLNYIDSEVGLNNTFIYLTGTGDTNDNTTDVEGTTIGTFTATRCLSLLNSYLISLYGQGQWVQDANGCDFYLNHKTIEQNNLKLSEVQRAAAEFVMMFSGVDEVVTQYQLLHEDVNDRIQRMRRAYSRLSGADLLISLQPGWVYKYKDSSDPKPQTRHDIAPGPAILFAPGSISPNRVTVPVDATAIAPTVARHIRIRAPSACQKAPL